jgi:hypothetical protein
MNMLNSLLSNLGNLDEIAAKLGLPADTVQGLIQSVQEKMNGGGDIMSAVAQSAQEHGVSLDRLQGLLGEGGGGVQDILGKVTSALDQDGDGNPLNDLGALAKGLFGQK